jgi:hypothetical protein
LTSEKLKMPLNKGSAAVSFEIKEIKRQIRAVKVTHPPADRRLLHKRAWRTPSQARVLWSFVKM